MHDAEAIGSIERSVTVVDCTRQARVFPITRVFGNGSHVLTAAICTENGTLYYKVE